MAGKPWAYESRSERRRRHIAALQRAASDAFLPLSQGDVSGARQALRGDAGVEPSYEPQMAPETPEQSPARVNDGAVLEGALKVLQGVRGKADMTGGSQGGGGGWLGKTLGAIDKVTPDAVTDPLGKVLGKGLEYSDKGREYVGGPLFGAVSGLTETERIYDPKTGKYYRKTASFADMGKGLLDAFSQDPRQTYREGKQGYEDYLADPNKSTAHRVIAMGVTDPLTYVGPGAVKGLLRGLPAGAQASKAARVTSALLESPGRASAGGILGAATGAEVAERAGADPREQMLATLGLGLVGGMAGGGLAGVKRGDVADAFGREAPVPSMVSITGKTGEYKPIQGDTVGGLFVWVDDGIPNTGSIDATFDNPEILPGIRSVPISDFDAAPRDMFYAKDDLDRVEKLAADIRESGKIKPLIVAIDDKGPYVLEGGHRLAALYEAGVKEFPALVVRDLDSLDGAPSKALTGQKGTFGDVLRESFGGTPLRTASQSLGGGIYGAMQEDEDPLGGFLFGAGTGLARGILKAPATTGVVTRAVDAAELARDAELGVPDYTNATIFDLPKLERTPPGRVDRAMNAIKRSIQGADAIEMDDVAAPAMRARERLKPVIESQANILAAKADNIVTKAFKRDSKGRIIDLPGAPTVQDVAARLPDFDPFLTPAQREAMAELRSIIEPYSRLLAEANVEFGSRMDIADGGYYLPRGRADVEGADAPVRGGGGRAGGRKGFEKHADFESMQKALDEGYEYSPFAESMRAYGVDAGKRAIDKHISDYFKTVTDEDGNLLASLPSDRMDPVIRGKWKEATGDLVKLRKRLATAEKRAKVAATAGDEVDDAITQFERGMPDEGMRDLSKLGTRLANEKKRGETLAARAVKEAADKPTRIMTGAGPVKVDMPATPAAQRRADILNARSEEVIRVVNKVDELVPEDVDRLRFLDTAMRRTEKRADVLAKRGGRYADTAEQIRREIRDLSERVDELRPEYKVALDKSRYLPRGMAYIDMTSLMGTAFPEKMAAAANRFLNAEKPLTGRRAGMTNAIIATNSLLRGLKATGDLSFMGIQGAIGAARDPLGYGRALRAAIKSLADPDVLGEYLRDFDANAAKRGRPTSVQWAERGLHIGGNTHEFTIGNSLPSRISGLIEKAPIVKQSNRSFGNFGDALRLQLADAAYGSTLLAKFDMTDAKNLDSIALYANRATGWNPTRFAGDFGDMVMFAPRFFQSQLSFLGMAAAGGNTPGAWEARRSIVQFLGAGTTLTVLANEFSDTPIPTEELFDPNSPNFMRFRFKGQDISLFGPWDSLMRGISNAARGDYTYMARTKASPVVAQAWNAITGKTFTGEDYYSPGTIFRELALPFSINDMGIVGGDKGVVGTLVGATGLKSTPMSPTDQLNTLARARFQSDFYDLEPSEQKAIKDAHPDVWERAVERGSALRVQGEEVKTRYIEEQTARDQMLMNGELTLEQWREARDDAYARKDGEMAQIYRDASFPDRNDVLSRYYDAMDAATVNGVFDPDVRQEFLDSLSEEDRALVERNTGLYATPTEKLFKKLASEYYELPQYRGYTADEARAINDLWQEVRNSARGSDDVYMLRALRQVGQGEDERVIRGVRRRILGLLREDRRRERYKRQHPEIALLTGSGKLTADLAELIRKVA